VISGLLSGRLGTGLHVGTMYPKIFGNTKSFYKLFKAIIVVNFQTSIFTSVSSFIFGVFLWGLTRSDFWDILITVSATMTLGLILSLVTIAVSFITFRRGLDPDIIQYPIMSTFADIFITVCYVFILTISFRNQIVVAFFGVIQFFATIYFLSRNIHDDIFVKTLKESFLTLLFVSIIFNLTGTILKTFSLKGSNEIYLIYPALISTVGDVGSIVGSTVTTKLALGLLTPNLSSMRNHMSHIGSAWLASMLMFIFYSAVFLLVTSTLTLYSFFRLSTLLLTINIVAIAAIVLISYSISILTFQKGLDPDNFVIPVESSLADSITSMVLFIVLMIAG
jgi:mgtE-like transporter